ncbi:MAG: hypothetical protein K6F80_00620 [Oscillospiraceae bacterium]|nr:hypothetical protein [Oscillospiraceae bacterium]
MLNVIAVICALTVGLCGGAVGMAFIYNHMKPRQQGIKSDDRITAIQSDLTDVRAKLVNSCKKLEKIAFSADGGSDTDTDPIMEAAAAISDIAKDFAKVTERLAAIPDFRPSPSVSASEPTVQPYYETAYTPPPSPTTAEQPQEMRMEQIFRVVEQLRQSAQTEYRTYNATNGCLEYVSGNDAPYILTENLSILPNQTTNFTKLKLAEEIYKCSGSIIQKSNCIRVARADRTGRIITIGEIYNKD